MQAAIGYSRVSTQEQGRSGLGIEAQREAVAQYVASVKGGRIIAPEFIEVESGKRDDRPELHVDVGAAVAHADPVDRVDVVAHPGDPTDHGSAARYAVRDPR